MLDETLSQNKFSLMLKSQCGSNLMGGNFPGGNFPGGNFPAGNFPGGNFPDTEMACQIFGALSLS